MRLEQETKRKGILSNFIHSYVKNSMPENFPKPGSSMMLELRKDKTGIFTQIPVELSRVNKRILVLKSFGPAKGYSTNGRLYCTFENNTVRQYTDIKIIGITKNCICIKIVNCVFTRAKQREYERLSYKKHYNFSLKAIRVLEKNDSYRKYNQYMKIFFKNSVIKDISPGGIGLLSDPKYSDLIKEGVKINVNICFGERMEYRYFKKMIKSRTLPKVIQTKITVRKKNDRSGLNYIGFQFENIEKNSFFIVDTINRINQSEDVSKNKLSCY